MRDWANRNTKLFYRPVGSGCVDVHRPGAKQKRAANEALSHKADDEALGDACTSKVPTLVRAESSNYPAIEGVHTMLEEESPSGTRDLIPVLIQMKTFKTVTNDHLKKWTQKAHARAKILGLKDRSYFVVLYVSNELKGQDWKSAIPEGTIVLKREALQQFLSPFGMTLLLQMLDTHAK